MGIIFGHKNINLDINIIKSRLQYKQFNNFNFYSQNNITFCQSGIDYFETMELDGNIIAFNGSIFNCEELRQEFLKDVEVYFDSEVCILLNLLKIYGLNILNKLNGTFSFAYYDKESGSTFLVNDRFGEKELFYYINEDSFAFCSSDAILLSVLNIPFEFDKSYIDTLYVKNIIDFKNKLINKNLNTVNAGEYVEITRDNKVRTKRYYKFDDFNLEKLGLNYKNKKEVINYFEDLLTDSIRIRCNKNTPITMTLSGGTDSSLIYTLIKEKLGFDVNVFTYSNENEELDEYNKAEKLTKKYNDKVIKIKYSKDTFEEDYKETLIALNLPLRISDTGFYSVYKKINEMGYKTVIEGHGADELFCGYPEFFIVATGQALFEKKYILAYNILNLYKMNVKRKLLYSEKNQIKKYLFQPKESYKHLSRESTDYLLRFRAIPIIIRYWNRMLTANSIESRNPFLDYRIVEFVRALPLEYKINKIGNKAILREILKKYKVDFIYKNKIKQGFTTSEREIINDQKGFFLKYYDKNRFNCNISQFDDQTYIACSVGFLEDYYKKLNANKFNI